MPGDYTDVEVASMSPDDLFKAANAGWLKPVAVAPVVRPEYAGEKITPKMPDPADFPVSPESPQPSGDVWKRRKSGQEIFTCPSGQTCRIRRVLPEQLMMTGILDKVTRLEGLAAVLVAQAEGAPPEKQQTMPTREELGDLLETVNAIIPLAVVEPVVLPDPPEGETPDADKLYASDIELGDRMAIMEYALRGVKSMDRFRNP